MDMVDNELTPPPVTQLSGENEYDEKFAESSSEFDCIILDAETKKRLAETIDSNGGNAKKNKALTLSNKTHTRNGKGLWFHTGKWRHCYGGIMDGG